MPTKHYNWKNGPAEIQPHSIAKHRIIQSYLVNYFKTLVNNPNRDELRLTLIDGFAGGGLYISSNNKNLIEGSPLILLNVTREAEFCIKKDRTKPFSLLVDYFFVEPDRYAYAYLSETLHNRGYGDEISKTIHLQSKKFQDASSDIINFIKRKSPKSGRSIFILDQYGYIDVPKNLIRKIFNQLPNAEVILTFGVDSLLNYANEENFEHKLYKIGVSDILRNKSFEEIKNSDKDWRLFIQSRLYFGLVNDCGAKYYTLFFIRNTKGHGDYWLIHLSQHYRARDVMTDVHWSNNNCFIHYGGPGLDMFQTIGYDPERDYERKGQSTFGFEFDDVARQASIEALNEQIPHRVYVNNKGLSFGELFTKTCNSSPASAAIYRESIGFLLEQKVIEIIMPNGGKRRSAKQIELDDQILPPSQRPIILF